MNARRSSPRWWREGPTSSCRACPSPRARQLRIAFSDPYLHSQLRAIFRQKDAAQFKTREDVLKTTAKIGVITGTTGDTFVSKNCPNAQRVTFTIRRDVPALLIGGGRMDLFIDDTFALANMISENESELAYLQQPLSEEDVAWGIRQDNRDLLAAVNSALAKWKTDGTLEKVLDRWVPYLKKIQTN
jgi:cystine transport system substrate-binding protein